MVTGGTKEEVFATDSSTTRQSHPCSAAVFANFQVNRLLGEVGFGAVYLARQISLERDVVVKVLKGINPRR